MEVRCGSCNKLFRIADEKISGSGIKFACSQCRGPVTITREEFEQYARSKTAEPVVPLAAPRPRKMEVRCGSCSKLFHVSEDKITGSGIKFACSKCGNPVAITRRVFEQYFEPNKTEPALPLPTPAVQEPLIKMEVRCNSCSKPFRIAEDKITGTGIKFACSKCGAPITISRTDLENYKRDLERTPAPAPISTESPASLTSASAPVSAPAPGPAATMPPKVPAESAEVKQQPPAAIAGEAARSIPAPAAKPAAVRPQTASPKPAAGAQTVTVPPAKDRVIVPPPVSAPKPVEPSTPANKPTPKPQPPPETKSPAPPQREQAKPAIKPRSEQPSYRPTTVVSASVAPPSSTSRQLMVLAIAILIIAAVGYFAILRFKASAPVISPPVSTLTSIDGIEIVNTSGLHNTKGDYVISGDIVNSTDVERPAWLVVAEVFDANGTVIGRARMLNGVELYTHRDYEILAKRGTNIQELKSRNLQEQRSKLLPKGTVHFEITIIEPPAGGIRFSANLQSFDPVQVFKEVIAEEK
jgi:DNA-directed RNA polymerase subunit M/transcription elongation factor TFIIS